MIFTSSSRLRHGFINSFANSLTWTTISTGLGTAPWNTIIFSLLLSGRLKYFSLWSNARLASVLSATARRAKILPKILWFIEWNTFWKSVVLTSDILPFQPATYFVQGAYHIQQAGRLPAACCSLVVAIICFVIFSSPIQAPPSLHCWVGGTHTFLWPPCVWDYGPILAGPWQVFPSNDVLNSPAGDSSSVSLKRLHNCPIDSIQADSCVCVQYFRALHCIW